MWNDTVALDQQDRTINRKNKKLFIGITILLDYEIYDFHC